MSGPSRSHSYSGWLQKYATKRSVFGLANWKRRHFVVCQDGLRYYEKECKDPTDEDLCGMVGWLQVVHIYATISSEIHPAAVESGAFYFGFRFLDAKKELIMLLAAGSDEDRSTWLRHLLSSTFCNIPSPRNLVLSVSGADSDGDSTPASSPRTLVVSRRHAPNDSPQPARSISPMPDKALHAGGVMMHCIKALVSKKKRRFQVDGFDLDLSYITDRIVAMGFPSEGRESLYRNCYQDVEMLLKKQHHGNYKVYNLCSERFYPPTHFDGSFTRFPFDDHNPPPLALMIPLCKDIHEWLTEDPSHVAAVHCKAGKGRTGVAIVAYLLYSKICPTLEEAHNVFNVQRTKDGKGVTVRSQRRYLDYFARLNGVEPPLRPIILRRLVLNQLPKGSRDGGSSMVCHIVQRVANHMHRSIGRHEGDVSKQNIVHSTNVHVANARRIEFLFSGKDCHVTDDVRIEVCEKGGDDVFQFWVHSSMVPADGRVIIPMGQLDVSAKDLFDSDMTATLEYSVMDPMERPEEARIHHPTMTRPKRIESSAVACSSEAKFSSHFE